MQPIQNVLFICSKNQWRSPTAEKVFADLPGIRTRSRGTSRTAVRTVSEQDLKWADLILVMEDKHKQRLKTDFSKALKYKAIHVLHIPDEYPFMDEALIEELRQTVLPLLSNG